jgi:2,3-dihydroxyphenylpropionate 1,2-dioxygenase
MSNFALACASHTPLLMREELAEPGICETVKTSFESLAAFIREFSPEQIIQFSPDHFHGFHYDLMPSFCVAAAATSYGDWGTSTGPLKVDEEYSLALLEAVRDADIDAAVSFDMTVDHGFVQMWEMMFGSFYDLPIIPIFVNAVGHPLPRYRRARLLGQAVGRFAAQSGRRVLFAASGGLSHDPLVPKIRGATSELRDRLTGRSHFDSAQQAAREHAVHSAGVAARKGQGPVRPLNPSWDQGFLAMLGHRDWEALDALTPEQVDLDAGSGANEVLSWVAAAAATEAAGGAFDVVQSDYTAIPGWIAGLAIFAAKN